MLRYIIIYVFSTVFVLTTTYALKRMKGLKKMIYIILSIIVVIAITVVVFVNQESFGALPEGDRLERVKSSSNYRDGSFHNFSHTPQLTSDKSFVRIMADFLFKKKERLSPSGSIPAVRTNLDALDRSEDVLVWFGHSSYLLQSDGRRFLVDPVLSGAASPVSFVNKPFKGSDLYRPEDIPDVDYLVISHDHWDHLDYGTIMQILPRTGKVICPLGAGAHFEYWGFDKERIIEMDWYEDDLLEHGFAISCLPARHFSGRGLSANRSLWASFLLQTPSRKIYIGGDSGFDVHFKAIGKRFGSIDLAILENGQYDEDWRYIHMMPEELLKAARDLNAKALLPVHNSKYALGNHPWDEPMVRLTEAYDQRNCGEFFDLLTPRIGELVMLNDTVQAFSRWWEEVE